MQRLVKVLLSAVVISAVFVAPAWAYLSMGEARSAAKRFAAHLAAKSTAEDYEVKNCSRSSANAVLCGAFFDYTDGGRCAVPITVRLSGSTLFLHSGRSDCY